MIYGKRHIRTWPLTGCGDKGEQRAGDHAEVPKPVTRKMAAAVTGKRFRVSKAWKFRVCAQESDC